LNDNGANVNGIWNLVLADKNINNDKRAKVPEIKYLESYIKETNFILPVNILLVRLLLIKRGKHRRKGKGFCKSNMIYL
jgi:hypothetical protein